MKIKVGDTWFECTDDQPIMVVLTEQDKTNIKNMNPECTKYAVFSDDSEKFNTIDARIDWMKQ